MPPYRQRPDWVRRLNQFGPATDDTRKLIPLDPDELLALARETTALFEIGDDHWLETYRRCLRSVDEESNANFVGRILARAETLRILQTKLRLEDAWRREPAILEEPIERPIFVLGAPRTGTTILLELLALDPALRAPIAWEAHHPLDHGRASDTTSKREMAEVEHEFWMDLQPELATLHEMGADLPCECIHFLSMEFGGPYWAMHYTTPSLQEWAAGQPEVLTRTYRFHRQFLQTLQHGETRRRWLLKSPGHLMTAQALYAEYPDAIIVHTHRDPHKFVGSAASTTALLHWLRSDHVDPLVHGQVALAGFAFMLGSVIDGRDGGTLPEDQIVDSHYLDLIEDPVAAIEKIYDQAGLAWPEGHAERIRTYLRDKPKGKHGKHQYSLEEYGIDPSAVDAAYSRYVERYGVRAEG